MADVTRGLNSLYVYCPLVEPRMVGDAQVPLLRIVPIEGRVAEMVTNHCRKRKRVVSRMKQPHHCQAKAYHDYYLHQAGRGYPVYVGTRYQRGHGLGSISGGLFKAAVPFLKKAPKLWVAKL